MILQPASAIAVAAQARLRRAGGYTSTMAMLFLVLFLTLSIGFYATVGTTIHTTYNEVNGVHARLAAESGMEFVRHHLASINIPANTAPERLFDEVYADLAEAMNGTANLGGGSIGFVSENEIRIPADPDRWIRAHNGDENAEFRATLYRSGQRLRVQVVGRRSGAESRRGIQLDYGVAQRASSIFEFGVASKSAISLNGNVSIRGTTGNEGNGSVLSTTLTNPTPLTMIGSPSISGDVSVTNPDPNSLSISANSRVAGYRPNQAGFADHVHVGVEPPEFPTVDTSVFEPFATNLVSTSNPSGTYFKNIRIRAGTNPTFASNTTIDGVVYVEYPNRVSFAGSANIRGVVVVQTNEYNNENLDHTQNLIDFGGNVSASPLSSLPATADFPQSLRELSGAMLLAPGFSTQFRGNFGTVSGSIIASQISFSGTAGGTIRGSVINLKDTALSLSGTTDIIIESQGTTDYPDGVFFGSNYAPLSDTYLEVPL